MTVPAFHREVEFTKFRVLLILPEIEVHALRDQPVDDLPAAPDGELHCRFVTKACAGTQGIVYVGLYRIAVVEHRRHPALGPKRRSRTQLGFGQHRHLERCW